MDWARLSTRCVCLSTVTILLLGSFCTTVSDEVPAASSRLEADTLFQLADDVVPQLGWEGSSAGGGVEHRQLLQHTQHNKHTQPAAQLKKSAAAGKILVVRQTSHVRKPTAAGKRLGGRSTSGSEKSSAAGKSLGLRPILQSKKSGAASKSLGVRPTSQLNKAGAAGKSLGVRPSKSSGAQWKPTASLLKSGAASTQAAAVPKQRTAAIQPTNQPARKSRAAATERGPPPRSVSHVKVSFMPQSAKAFSSAKSHTASTAAACTHKRKSSASAAHTSGSAAGGTRKAGGLHEVRSMSSAGGAASGRASFSDPTMQALYSCGVKKLRSLYPHSQGWNHMDNYLNPCLNEAGVAVEGGNLVKKT